VTIKVRGHDPVWDQYECEASLARDLSDHFTFEAPGYKFSPAYKKGGWDGKIRLFDSRRYRLYAGLRERVREFCRAREIPFEEETPRLPAIEDGVAGPFLQELGLPVEPHDYQVETVDVAIRDERRLFVSPTASGKSLMIYGLCRWFEVPTLIVVPTVALVHQMEGDFVSYGCPSGYIQKLAGGMDVKRVGQVMVSTWQTAVKQDQDWFDQFEMVVGDEAHLFKAKSLTDVMTRLTRARYRFGFTGTLDGSHTNQMVLEGLFGPVHHVTTTRRLMDRGIVASLKVEVLRLEHPDHGRKELAGRVLLDKKFKKNGFMTEVDYLTRLEARNQFISNLVRSRKGNTLVLFQRVEGHGIPLHEMIKEGTKRPVMLVHGGVDGLERNDVRALVENEEDAILVASYGTTSTGINIRRINNVVFAQGYKARVVNLQSIGRGLRLADGKVSCTLYDVGDDLTYKGRPNYALNHMVERVRLYASEGFDYRLHRIELKY
jgi:superfamily II DNA or RNA helicase